MKARIKFSKTGSMRFIGHLDVMRYFQKAFRRADINISYSKGYSPHQLMSFASPLGIGLSSDAEYLDIVLEEDYTFDVMIDRLNAVMNDEIRVKDFTILDDNAKPSMSILAACDYLVALKPRKKSEFTNRDFLAEKLSSFLAEEKIEVVKKTKKSEKLTNIRDNIYCMAENIFDFERYTGIQYGRLCIDELCIPVIYMQLTAGSVVNLKPELVMETFSKYSNVMFNPLDFQIHRLEMYADAGCKKGEVHTRSSEIPLRLVPLYKKF